MKRSLSPAHRRLLARDGYVVVPGVVPGKLIDPVLRLINNRLGSRKSPGDGFSQAQKDWRSDLVGAPAAMDLLQRSPVAGILESLLGEGNVTPCSQAQIALRFPAELGEAPARPDAHIDGLYRTKLIQRFTLLAGILLNDVPEGSMGNFTVYPGSHRVIAQYFKDHGAVSARSGFMKNIPLPQPVQITGKAGDLVLCHHQLAHGKAQNFSPEIRYMAYFRVYHADAWRDQSEAYVTRALTDLWLEWPGMREARGT